jgi:hypothetical protein
MLPKGCDSRAFVGPTDGPPSGPTGSRLSIEPARHRVRTMRLHQPDHALAMRRSRRSPTTSRCCSSSTTTRPSTGSTCAQRTRSSPRSRPSGIAGNSPAARGPRPGVTGSGAGDGFQANRSRPGPLACAQRATPGRPGPHRRDLHQRQARRTTRRTPTTRSRLKDLHPQVLTIARQARPRPLPLAQEIGHQLGRALSLVEQQVSAVLNYDGASIRHP